MYIQKALTRKFVEIIAKHQNAIWTIDELKWLVYDKHRGQFDQLSEFDQKEVFDYFDALHKLHGGN